MLGIPAGQDGINPIFERKFHDDSFGLEVAGGNILGLVEKSSGPVKSRGGKGTGSGKENPNQVSGEISRRSQDIYRLVS